MSPPLRLLCVLWLAAGLRAGAQEIAPSCCGHQFTLTGEFKHSPRPKGINLPGLATERLDEFDQEIHGKSFTATIPGLSAGEYRIAIDLAEVSAKGVGQRVMDIKRGDAVLSGGLDIFKEAGFGHPYRINLNVQHLGDAQRGPLAITFTGVKGEAKFNAIFVTDAAGNPVGCVVAKDVAIMDDPQSLAIPDIKEPPIFRDPAQPLDKRVDDLIRRMSLSEKVHQLVDDAAAIPRLGVPAYGYWNECLHGVARAGLATVFPEPTGLAATWDTALAHDTAEVISTEARAKYNETGNGVNHARHHGLTFWTPNINIFRDPRWGRGQETYGEDPFLTARLGVAFIQGLQGTNPRYLKAAACAKHFAVHSGPEPGRAYFNVEPPERDLYETYLPQFQAAVEEGKVEIVMGAYNALYGEPCCSNPFLLTDLLRRQWGFSGQVVSDCGAVTNIYRAHKKVATPQAAAARAIKAGLDIECGGTMASLVMAGKLGLITSAEIDGALHFALATRFKLGMFDPPGKNPYDAIAPSENDTPAHRALALKSARESIVLLKNNGILPLDRTKIHRVAVIGMNADSVAVLLGNYNGTPSAPVTFLKGIQAAAGPGLAVLSAKGCPLALKTGQTFGPDAPGYKQAMDAVAGADVVLYVGGISPQLEGEEMRVGFPGFNGGDRTRIELPPCQTDFLKALKATGKPVVFVDCSGGAMAIPWEAANLDAILQAWYPGEQGGTALANVLFGGFNPSGRLPVTFYESTDDLPPFTDYGMANRTYRYFTGKPLYPFGYGLSYTRFDYGTLRTTTAAAAPTGTIHVALEVKNSGARDGEEVVQFYAKHLDSKVPQPIHSLVAFRRIPLAAGESKQVGVDIPANLLRYWDTSKKGYVVEPGKYEIQAGASSADLRGSVPVKIAAP